MQQIIAPLKIRAGGAGRANTPILESLLSPSRTESNCDRALEPRHGRGGCSRGEQLEGEEEIEERNLGVRGEKKLERLRMTPTTELGERDTVRTVTDRTGCMVSGPRRRHRRRARVQPAPGARFSVQEKKLEAEFIDVGQRPEPRCQLSGEILHGLPQRPP